MMYLASYNYAYQYQKNPQKNHESIHGELSTKVQCIWNDSQQMEIDLVEGITALIK